MNASPEKNTDFNSKEGMEDALEHLEAKLKDVLDPLYSDLRSLHFRLLELEENSKQKSNPTSDLLLRRITEG